MHESSIWAGLPRAIAYVGPRNGRVDEALSDEELWEDGGQLNELEVFGETAATLDSLWERLLLWSHCSLGQWHWSCEAAASVVFVTEEESEPNSS